MRLIPLEMGAWMLALRGTKAAGSMTGGLSRRGLGSKAEPYTLRQRAPEGAAAEHQRRLAHHEEVEPQHAQQAQHQQRARVEQHAERGDGHHDDEVVHPEVERVLPQPGGGLRQWSRV